MKFSYKWLKKLSGTKKSAQEVADMLILHSFEVEDVIEQGKGLENIVIGEVLTKEKHPNADRLNVTTVDVGKTEKLQIVCGAPNLEVGQKVPVALVGALLPGDFKIKKSNIREVESQGMICAEDELGIGEGHEGIMVLANDAPVGSSFSVYEGLGDIILDIDVLPNRAHDALSYEGMAREIAALEGRKISFSENEEVSVGAGSLNVSVETKACSRYMGVYLKNITLGESPDWLKARLKASDIGSINNVVDITNYVMLETGQPLHAFSAKGGSASGWDLTSGITVRMAEKGEKIQLLDDAEKELTQSDIVIANNEMILALAGVMGGKESGIANETTEVILEAANFNASSIRKTRTLHGIHSDSSYRFERDIDPNLAQHAAKKAVKLLKELAGAEVVAAQDVYPEIIESWEVRLKHSEIERLLGVSLQEEKIMELLENISVDVSVQDKEYGCTIPTWRRDLTIPADLIEEIGRLYGYDKIKPVPLQEDVQPAIVHEQRRFERTTKEVLISFGYNEVRSYSFYSPQDAKVIGLDNECHVELLNPMSEEQEWMRRSLTPGILKASAKNLSYEDAVRIFDIGRVYTVRAESLPDEKTICCLAYTAKDSSGIGFLELKGVIESYLERLSLRDIYFDEKFDEDTVNAVDLHPSRKARILSAEGKSLGYIGEVTKKAHKYFGVKKARTVVCELDLDAIRQLSQEEMEYEPLAKYPSVTRDLSLVVESRTRVADVERVLYSAGGDFLQDVDLFDLYVHPETQERSMAFHLIFSDPERTLKAKEIDNVIGKMTQELKEKLGITIKGDASK